MDLTPLRTAPQFRLLLGSGFVTGFGSMATLVAIPFQVAILTDSFIAVGLIGLAELIPLVVLGLFGGSLADTVDRRRMVIVTEIAAAVVSVVLLVNALAPAPQLWTIYLAAFLFAGIDGLQRPSIESMLARSVPHEQLSAAGALNSLQRNVSSIGGPAVAGIILAAWGPAAAYGLDVATFLVSAVLLWRLRAVPRATSLDERAGLRHIITGLRYAWHRKDLLGTYAVDLAAMTFAFPFALFPFIAQDFQAEWSLGILYAAGAVGSLIFGVTSGWAPRIHRHGRAIAISAALWGTAIALIAIAPTIWWVVVLLVVAGYFDMVSGHFRLLMWNESIPHEMRGRMAGIEVLSYSMGPMLGQVRSTAVAQLTSLRTSLWSGGVVCIVAVGVACLALPAMWRYDNRTDPNVALRRSQDGQNSV